MSIRDLLSRQPQVKRPATPAQAHLRSVLGAARSAMLGDPDNIYRAGEAAGWKPNCQGSGWAASTSPEPRARAISAQNGPRNSHSDMGRSAS